MGSANVCPVEWGITPTSAQGLAEDSFKGSGHFPRCGSLPGSVSSVRARSVWKSDTAEPGVRSPSKNPRFEGPVRETTPRYRVCVENVSKGRGPAARRNVPELFVTRLADRCPQWVVILHHSTANSDRRSRVLGYVVRRLTTHMPPQNIALSGRSHQRRPRHDLLPASVRGNQTAAFADERASMPRRRIACHGRGHSMSAGPSPAGRLAYVLNCLEAESFPGIGPSLTSPTRGGRRQNTSIT